MNRDPLVAVPLVFRTRYYFKVFIIRSLSIKWTWLPAISSLQMFLMPIAIYVLFAPSKIQSHFVSPSKSLSLDIMKIMFIQSWKIPFIALPFRMPNAHLFPAPTAPSPDHLEEYGLFIAAISLAIVAHSSSLLIGSPRLCWQISSHFSSS